LSLHFNKLMLKVQGHTKIIKHMMKNMQGKIVD
jgi:hypothetical protein